jgi:hypothetical protein
MAAERNVSLDNALPAFKGGHGKSALSVPMREDSPAARMTPPKVEARIMQRR